MLNPVFSAGHLRDMMPTFYEVSYKVRVLINVFGLLPLSTLSTQLRDAIKSKSQGGPQDIDILHWIGRTALELIGQSGLGRV
jgi:hypothetical protein